MVTFLRLRLVSAASGKAEELQLRKFNIDLTANVWNNLPENIDEHCSFPGSYLGHRSRPEGCHKK